MLTFTPPSTPTIDSTVAFTANTLEAAFGDGYEQVATTGLNAVSGAYSVSWDTLTQTDRDTIEAFLRSQGGWQAFLYTFPTESTARKFRCKTWSRGHTGGLYTLRADFREVFDLA